MKKFSNKKQNFFYNYVEMFTKENSKKHAIENFNKFVESWHFSDLIEEKLPKENIEKIILEFKEYFNSKIDEIFTDFDIKLATKSIDYVYSQIELIDDGMEKFFKSTDSNYFMIEIRKFLKSKNIFKDWRFIDNLIENHFKERDNK